MTANVQAATHGRDAAADQLARLLNEREWSKYQWLGGIRENVRPVDPRLNIGHSV